VAEALIQQGAMRVTCPSFSGGTEENCPRLRAPAYLAAQTSRSLTSPIAPYTSKKHVIGFAHLGIGPMYAGTF
jgi:hypothetical protein